MKSTARSRRHRNAHTQETQPQEQATPFFAKSEDHSAQKPFFNGKGSQVQPKLSVGQPGDKYEREADSVADRVVNHAGGQAPGVQQKQEISSIQRLATPVDDEKLGTNDARMAKDKEIQEKPDPAGKEEMKKEEDAGAAAAVQKMEAPKEEEKPGPVQKMDAPKEEEKPGAVQKKDAPKEEEKPGAVQKMDAPKEEEKPGAVQKKDAPKEEEKPVQTKADAPSTVSPALSGQIEGSKGRGRPLPDKTRAEMEQGIGADFRGVNIHTGAEAAGMNRELGAQAFTHGQDVYFNDGKYNPDTSNGKRLLAHELTHVVQQNPSNIAMKESASPKKVVRHGSKDDKPGMTCRDHFNPDGTFVEPSGEQNVRFVVKSSTLSTPAQASLRAFIDNWHKNGAKDPVEINGYASIEGQGSANWSLSCRRAESVRQWLIDPTDKGAKIPDSFISVFANGITNKFGGGLDENRVVTFISNVKVPDKKDPKKNDPILPDPNKKDKPVGPVKPPDTPAKFCTAFTDKSDALDAWAQAKIALDLLISAKFGGNAELKNLWNTYLSTPKKGTKGILPPRKLFGNPKGTIENAFRNDPETFKQQQIILKKIADKVKADPKLLPPEGQSTMPMNFTDVLSSGDLTDLPMNFTDPANRIPGFIAGGVGKDQSDAGDDVRNANGKFIVTNLGLDTIKVRAAFVFDVLDAVDFCPGNPGGFFAQFLTIDLSRLEATPDFPTYDTPFEVVFGAFDDSSF